MRYRIKLKDTKVNDGVDYDLANNTTDPDVLRHLAKDENYSIRKCVIRNPNCPLDVLRYLVGDKDRFVRAYLAQTTKDVDILRKLSNDDEDIVLGEVAYNKNKVITK